MAKSMTRFKVLLIVWFALCGVLARITPVGAAAHDLHALAACDGWVSVRVELMPSVQGAATDDAIEDLLFGLPEGSYTNVERLPEGAALVMRVDAAGLDGLLVAMEVVGITLASTHETLWPLGPSTEEGPMRPTEAWSSSAPSWTRHKSTASLRTRTTRPAGLEPERQLFSTWVIYVAGAAAKIPEVVVAVRRLPDVAYAEPDYRVSTSARPNDPSFRSLWGLENTGQTGGTPGADIRAVEARDLATGDSDTVVAVIDTGVDYAHPDLAANMWVNAAERDGLPGIDDDGNGYIDEIHDAITGPGLPLDDHGHGTHCAETIGAVGNNGIGVTGVSWRTKIMALNFPDWDG